MKRIKFFIYSSGAVLLAAAIIRFMIAAENAQALSLPEPVLGMPLRYAVLMVGGFELVVALVCLFGKRVSLQVGLVAWLATDFIGYRIGLLWMHDHPVQTYTTCIGSLTDPLDLLGRPICFIIDLMRVYVLLGSYTAMVYLWRSDTTAPLRSFAPNFVKMPCSFCKNHIEFPIQGIGKIIPCPHCKMNITLSKPAEIIN